MRLAVTGELNAAVFDSLLTECQACLQGADPNLVLDLSSAEWGYPTGLVPFACLLRVLARRGVQIEIAAYPENYFCSYYCRVDFFRQIGLPSPCDGQPRRSGEYRFISITELAEAQIEAESRAKLTRLLQRLPPGVDATEVLRSSFIDACGELVSNTRHAYYPRLGGELAVDRPQALIQGQFYPSRGVVEFCVCDCGAGIKRSMEGEHQDGGNYASHLEAIVAALAFRNRNPIGGGAGLGLSALEGFVKKNGGNLRIRSGDALRVQRPKAIASTEHLPHWNGTVVGIEIVVAKSVDLSRIWRRLAQ
jgi:hypothetical protein